MKCPKCHHENAADAKFCAQCATPLARVCGNCGSAVSATAKFCSDCGHLVAPGPNDRSLRPPKSYTPRYLADQILTARATLEGERKLVTVLFADITGSMQLLAGRDPEDAHKLLDPAVERMIDAVHRYEGTVNRVMGDGIMALFGAPLAHEDHAVRACYAALSMQESVKRYSDEVQRSYGVPLTIRVGLDSGEIVVVAIGNDLYMEYTVVGQTAHLAARLEQMAVPRSVLITVNTAQLVEGYVILKPLGPVSVKGLVDPVSVYELTGTSAARTRLQAALGRGLTRFVGREKELKELDRGLAQAAIGHGQLISLVGEAGIGKSRLLYEFIHSHGAEDWLVIESGSAPHSKAPPGASVTDLLKSYFGIESIGDSNEVKTIVIAKILALDQELQTLITPLLALLDPAMENQEWCNLDPAQRLRLSLEAVLRVLIRQSQNQPLLVAFDDLRSHDSVTQSLLDGLIGTLPGARILLLVSFRPEYQHGWSGKSYYKQLRLEPLPDESVHAMLAALLGSDAQLLGLKQLLIAWTERNPFFIEESVRTLVETGVLSGRRGAYRLEKDPKNIQVPPTVEAVLTARIDRLSSEQKRVLQCAAVVGKDVPLSLLRTIAELDEDELRRTLGVLQAAEFLYVARLFPDPVYTFKHALTHEVTYGRLLQDRRRSLHRRIAEALEVAYSNPDAERVELLAHHTFRGEDWAKAVTYLQQAGAIALARSVHRESVRCFEDALMALSHLPETRETLEQGIDLRFGLRNALLPLVEWERIQGHLREAETLARKLNDKRRLASVSGYLSGLHLNTGGPASDVRAFAEEVEAIGASLRDVPLQVAGRYYHVWLGALSGDYRGTERLCQTLIDALPGDLSRKRFGLVAYPAVVAHAFLARALAELGAFDEGRDHGEEAIRLAEALDHPFSLIWACLNLGRLESLRGEFVRAIMLLERAAALSQEWNIAYLTPIALAALGHVYARSGRVEEGVTRLRQALAGYASAGIGYLLSISRVQLGEAYLLAGRVEEAREVGTRAVALARERGERGHEAWAYHLLGETASHRDYADVATAEAHYASSTALALELGMRPLGACCHFSLGKLYGRAGDRRVSEHLATAMRLFNEMGMRFWAEKAERRMQALEVAGVAPGS
jgi:class 3 adenylate cyclase/tetratricopeptide (TPR) repeat protein